MLRQYVAIDHEISQLEDKDALRIYHEKIEQLEMLERELDMISSETEEVAARNNNGLERQQSSGVNIDSGEIRANDLESNSLVSGATGSMSANSSIAVRQDSQRRKQQQGDSNNNNSAAAGTSAGGNKSATNNRSSALVSGTNNNSSHQQLAETKKSNIDASRTTASTMNESSRRYNKKSSYSTVEEVFNRKIILEKKRDKLKKEVEAVIVECDKLQQRYKKRDDILDKLFDGRAGNGLENHLEQQLNWLLEQKHYVDQVFYAWKRAETLTSRTCEQLASAVGLLKKLPDIEEEDQRNELIKSICDLLKASRQDMEQAQKYNPNVDAPFLTEAETKRFDKIIDTISSGSVKSSEFGQITTVIQFAYKRAASIKLWLEQILQITIARDSFELAEEYKWIAIQLRKERITLIKTKLQESPYRSMVRSVQEQMARQQQQLATDNKRVNEINRDSGVESDDIDIEEEIYRLLELNKARMVMEGVRGANRASANGKQQLNGTAAADGKGLMTDQGGSKRMQLAAGGGQRKLASGGDASGGSASAAAGNSWGQGRDQAISDRIERRMRGDIDRTPAPPPPPSQGLPPDQSTGAGETTGQQGETGDSRATTTASQQDNMTTGSTSQVSSAVSQLPSKLKVELDEAAKQDLLSKLHISISIFASYPTSSRARLNWN